MNNFEKYHSPLVVGLTGGIGAGKSTIVDQIRLMGFPVFDCDKEVHALYEDETVLSLMSERFGDLGDEPRREIAKRAWSDSSVLKEIEGIIGPQLLMKLLAFVDNHVAVTRKLVLIDAPTLFEHEMHDLMDWVISVHAPEEMRWTRVQSRQDMTRDKFIAVTKAQISDDERLMRSDSIIFNTGDLNRAVEQTNQIFKKLEAIANEASD